MLSHSFYIDGVTCSGCLRKIYSLKPNYPKIELSVDMSRNTLLLLAPKTESTNSIQKDIESLGFKLHPIEDKNDALKINIKENRSFLIKIAVAALFAGNIMLFSVSIYSGAEGDLGKYFEWLTFILFLPILFYSATPFYINTLDSFKRKRLSIDVPITVSIILGAGLSVYNLFYSFGKTYFDSLAILVFLLLSSRYFLKKMQQKYLGISYLKSFLPSLARKMSSSGDECEMLSAESIKVNDIMLVKKGELIPLDGQLVSKKASLNNSVITGEARPVEITQNQNCYSGTMLLSERAVIKVTSTSSNSRISLLFEKLDAEIKKPSQLTSFTDRASSLFVIILFIIGFIFCCFYLFVDPEEAIHRFLALIILACPCAIALATPLSQSLSLIKASKKGLLIKNAEVFERFVKIKNIVFDKTGTLTVGEFKLIKWERGSPSLHDLQVIYELERNSSHPLANAFKNYYWDHLGKSKAPCLETKSHKEVSGVGVSCQIEMDNFELKSYKLNKTDYTAVGLYKNNSLLNVAYLGDELREDSFKTIKMFLKNKFSIFILSGDNEGAVKSVGLKLGLSNKNLFFNKNPEQKHTWVQSHPLTLMVGDGVNDSLALASSHLSIAASGSMESTLKASDVYLSQPGLYQIYELYELSKETLKVIRRNLGFSLVYNLLGATFALMGYISPLLAAILMPLSSLFVLSSSLWGTSFLRGFNRASKTSTPKGPEFNLTPKYLEASH